MYFAPGAGELGLASLGGTGAMNAATQSAIASLSQQLTSQILTAAVTGNPLNLDADALLKSTLQAGMLSGLTATLDTGLNYNPETANFAKTAQRTFLKSAIEAGVTGESFEGILKDSTLSVTADKAFNYVGHTLYDDDGNARVEALEGINKNVIHGLVGGTLSKIGGGEFTDAAIATGVSHAVAEYASSKLNENTTTKKVKIGDEEITLVYRKNIEKEVKAIGEIVAGGNSIDGQQRFEQC